MEILDAEETATRLPYVDLAESIQGMALERASGGVQAPAGMSLPLPESGVPPAMAA